MKANHKKHSPHSIQVLAMAGFLALTASTSCARVIAVMTAAGAQAIENPSSGTSIHTIESSNSGPVRVNLPA